MLRPVVLRSARLRARRAGPSRPAHQRKRVRSALPPRRVGVGGGDEAAGSIPASFSTRRRRRARGRSRRRRARGTRGASLAGRRRRRGQRARRDCTWRKPCWAIASPCAARSRSQVTNLRSTVDRGCRSRAGITSSVTRSTPRSSSQSRISAPRSNVAGSMSCTATASVRGSGGTRASRARRWRPRQRALAVAGGEPIERALPGARGDAARAPRRAAGAAAASRRARAARRRARRRVGWASSPSTPSSISSRGPPAATATTGRPLAWASSTTWPKVSVSLGKQKTSALA